MNNIKLTVFDAFSYLVPGCVLLAILILFDGRSSGFPELSFAEAGLGLVLGYAAGFGVDAATSAIFMKLTQRSIDRRVGGCRYAEMYVICDIVSREVRAKVDQFNAMSGMARNLAVCAMVLLCMNWTREGDWLFIGDHDRTFLYGSLLVLVGVTLVHKAFLFRRWAHDLLYEVYVLGEKREGS